MFSYYLGSLGSDVELAAWGAVQKISNALMAITIGVAQGVRPLLAYNYAAGLYARVKALIRGAFVVMLPAWPLRWCWCTCSQAPSLACL